MSWSVCFPCCNTLASAPKGFSNYPHLLIIYTCSVPFPSPSRTASWQWPDSEAASVSQSCLFLCVIYGPTCSSYHCALTSPEESGTTPSVSAALYSSMYRSLQQNSFHMTAGHLLHPTLILSLRALSFHTNCVPLFLILMAFCCCCGVPSPVILLPALSQSFLSPSWSDSNMK